MAAFTSSRSFFDDTYKPSSFTSMGQWTHVRDFFFYFSQPYKGSRQINKNKIITYTDIRAVSYEIGTALNTLQEDYHDRLSEVSLQGRLIAEAAVTFLEPPAPSGYPRDATLAKKIEILALSSDNMADTSFKKKIIPALKTMKDLGNCGAHIGIESIKPSEKPVMVDAVFTVVNYLMIIFERRWSKEYSATIAKLQTRKDRTNKSRAGPIVFSVLGVVAIATFGFLIYRRTRA